MDNVIIYDAIDGVLNECETVMGGVKNIQGTLANGMVKSVQRGVSDLVLNANQWAEVATISQVNINKSILLIDGQVFKNATSGHLIYSLGVDKIQAQSDENFLNSTAQKISWTVVEFY